MNEVAVQRLMVEVQVMKIGAKQVTLSMFRQFQSEKSICDKTGQLNIDPWGYVNHHIDCDKTEHEHLHVVWQDGRSIKRSVMLRNLPHRLEDRPSFTDDCPSGYEDLLTRLSHTAEDIVHALYVGEHYGKLRSCVSIFPFTEDRHRCCRMNVRLGDFHGWAEPMDYTDQLYQLAAQGFPESDHWKSVFVKMPEAETDSGIYMTWDEIYKDGLEACRNVDLFRLNWQHAYQSILDRGQLFIAV